MSQRVCAKMLEFVFGRSIATKSLEEVGICSGTRLGIHNFHLKIQLEILAELRLQPVQQHHIAQRASRTAVRNSSSSNGLMKKADAPDFSEVARTSGSSLPVNMMTRVEGESSRTRD